MKNIRSAINIPAWASAAKESGSSGWGWKVPAGFGLASLALAACTTPANAPAEIRNSSIVNYCSVSQTDIDEQIAAGTPISYYIDLTPECIGEANQREIADTYGGKVIEARVIIGLKPNPNDSNIKLKDFDDNKQVDFFIYHLDNGKDIGVFPGMGGDYNKSSLHEVNTYISPNDKDKTIEYSWGYRDPNNEDTAITFFTVSLPNLNNLTQDEILNQYISNPNFIGSLGSPTRIILSNPSSKEEIIIDLKPGNTWIERLLDATITGVAHAQSLPTKTPPPLTEIPPTVTPLPPTKIATATDIPITTYSIEELNAMSSADKLALAPPMTEVKIPTGVAWSIESQGMVGKTAVVYYDKDGRQRAAYDLERGVMYDGVSQYEYDKSMPPLTVFFDNDSEALKEIPEKYLIKGQEQRLGEAMFAALAIDWAYPRLINVEMLEHNSKYGLGKVEAQWKFYNDTIKPAFIKALLDGTVWSEGQKGILVEGQKIKNELPTFVVVRGRDDSMPKSVLKNDVYYYFPWVKVEYNEDSIFNVLISPPAEVYNRWTSTMIGGELVGLRGLVVDELGFGTGSPRDFSKIISLILLGGKPRIYAVMNDSQAGDRDNTSNLPFKYPGLPDEYYEQGIDE